MNVKELRTAIITLLLLLLVVPAGLRAIQPMSKDSSSIRKLLEQRDREIKELMGPKGTEYTQKQRDKLKDIINNIVDYRAMAEYALQATYDTLTTQERDEFVDLFSNIVRDQSMNKLDIYRAKVTYNKIDVTDDSAYVKTMAQLEDVRTPVNYNMKFENGQWYITDMVIDDVSTAASYRRSFQNVIRKKGYGALVQSLRKRAERAS